MNIDVSDGPIQDEQRQYLSKVGKEAGFAFSGRVFGLLFGFVAQTVFARLLGADIMGVFVLSWTVLLGVTLLTNFGFEYSLVRYIAKYVTSGRPGEGRSALLLGLRTNVATSLVLTAAVILLREPIAIGVFHEPRLAPVLLWMSLGIVPYSLMRTLGGALCGLKEVKWFTIGFDVSHRVIRFALFLLLFYVGSGALVERGLFDIVASTVIATFACAALLAVFLWWRGGEIFGGRAVAAAGIPGREIMSYSSALLADAFIAFALQHSGRILLGVFLVPADVGVYNIVSMLGMLITFVVLSFNPIFSPVISDLFHRDRLDLLRPLVRSVTRWVILMSLPFYAWIIVAGESTLGVFGDEFVRGYTALVLVGTGRMIGASAGPGGITLAMTGYQKWNIMNALVLALTAIGLSIVFVPRMGIAGAGLATGIALALIDIARLVEARLLLKINPYDRGTVKVAVTAAIVVALSFLTHRFVTVPSGVHWSAAVFVACVLAVGLLTVALGVREEDRLVLRSVLNRVRRVRGGNSGDGA